MEQDDYVSALAADTFNAGMSIDGLYRLVSTGEACGIKPLACLVDVLPRVHHSKRRLDEFLPGP